MNVSCRKRAKFLENFIPGIPEVRGALEGSSLPVGGESTHSILSAHNYNSHFGRLPQLQPGDIVIFTDVSGQDHFYEVVLLETLPPQATEEMLASGFGLSLYTCTPGGGNRVTVRCNAIRAQ